MFRITNMGQQQRVFYDAFGRQRSIKPGDFADMELHERQRQFIQRCIDQKDTLTLIDNGDGAFKPQPNVPPLAGGTTDAASSTEKSPLFKSAIVDTVEDEIMGDGKNKKPRARVRRAQAPLPESSKADSKAAARGVASRASKPVQSAAPVKKGKLDTPAKVLAAHGRGELKYVDLLKAARPLLNTKGMGIKPAEADLLVRLRRAAAAA